ncbi:MAG TPA: hypothetical protein VI968_00315 [archaeon]|nr:hypothetical protein [archaeon]
MKWYSEALLVAGAVLGSSLVIDYVEKCAERRQAAAFGVNYFNNSNLTSGGNGVRLLGSVKERIDKVDVTGDGQPDNILIFYGGHIFYADGNQKPGRFLDYSYARIRPNTPEAACLEAATGFVPAEPRKKMPYFPSSIM